MNRDLVIFNEYRNGKTIYSLSKEYEIDKKTIKRIIEHGRYYLDIKSGEIVFSSKRVGEKEQQFNYLCYHDNKTKGKLFKYNSNMLFNERAINPRLADYLGVNRQNTYNWSKKEQRLFGCDENGVADTELVMKAYDFMSNEIDEFLKNKPYYIDDNGMVRGYKLWYVEVTNGWLYYLKYYAYRYVSWVDENKGKSIKGFYNKMEEEKPNDKYVYINTRVGIELGRWILKCLGKYSFEHIARVINGEVGELVVPKYFYLEKSAYYNELLSDEYRKMVGEWL